MKSMRNAAVPLAAMALACIPLTSAWAGTEGSSSTFYGFGAGGTSPATANSNTFIGRNAGAAATVGADNTYVGASTGAATTTGNSNTYLGGGAGQFNSQGNNNTLVGYRAGGNAAQGSRNVFIGGGAGLSEFNSDRLYIDNCHLAAIVQCDRPLIYGEFDSRLVDFDGVVHVTASRTDAIVKSQLHFSVTGDDVGGWITSAGDNNFFTSSGARYDADAGGWIQRSADGKAVIAGSGAAGFRVLTSSGGAVGGVVAPVSRFQIDYSGLMGVNTAPVAGRAINTSTGAYLSSGGVWTNASSRALKDDIRALTAEEAKQAFEALEPVHFRYKDEAGAHVGFIAEDVPALVATADRKGLSAMDVVAVLTKVVQQQASDLEEMRERLRRLEAR